MLHLPSYATPFIGREHEVARLTQFLREHGTHRLVTVLGPGGIGKTRLAVQSAQQVVAEFPDGVYFVGLQPIESADLLAVTIAETLDMHLSGDEAVSVQLLRFLHDRRVLLLLDNFEHLRAGGSFLADLLRDTRGVTLLVTSREALNLREEWLLPVSGLAYPTSAANESFSSYSAIQLFLQAAARVQPDVSLADEAEGMLRLCRLVEGAPLALELAASWAKTLSCAEIADEIQHNLDFLAARWQNVQEPHRSMRAVFASSWALLPPEEQAVFKRLTMFQDSFRRHAAEQIADATLLTLVALVDKSLLRSGTDGRFRIHELLRQFAAEQLAQNADEATAIARRHALYFCDVLRQHTPALHGGQQKDALNAIDEEWNDIRAAWTWVVEQRETAAMREMVDPLNLFYDFRGRYLEGIDAFEAALTALKNQRASSESEQVRGLLLAALCGLYLRVGQMEQAEALGLQCHALYQKLGIVSPPGYALDPLMLLGLIASARGDYARTKRLGEEALQVSEQHEQPANQRMALYLLGRAALLQNEPQQAEQYFQRCYVQTQNAGDRWFMAYCLNELGNLQRSFGQLGAASHHFTESYAIREEFNDPEGMAVALENLGLLAIEQGHYKAATEHFTKCLAIARAIQNRGVVAAALYGLGCAALASDNAPAAASFFAEALSIARSARLVTQLLSLIVEVARLLAPRAPERAQELFRLVQTHPGSPPESRTRAQAAWHGANDASPQIRGEPMNWEQLEALVVSLEQALALGAFDATKEPDSATTAFPSRAASTSTALVEPLTEREQQVLTLIDEGLSNAEIADRLILAVGTVKYYTSEIYGKLGVRNRVEAIRRARELGLLA